MILCCLPLKNHKFQINRNYEKDVTQTTVINSPAGAYNGVNAMTDDQDIRVRKYGEVVYNTLSSVTSILEYPKGKIVQNLRSWNVPFFLLNTSLISQI